MRPYLLMCLIFSSQIVPRPNYAHLPGGAVTQQWDCKQVTGSLVHLSLLAGCVIYPSFASCPRYMIYLFHSFYKLYLGQLWHNHNSVGILEG